MEIDFAVRFCALYNCSCIGSLFAAYDTSYIELAEVKLVHFYWGSWCHLRSWHPQGTAVMDPVVQSICDWTIFILQFCLVFLQEMAIIFRDAVVLLLMLVEIQLKFILRMHMLSYITQWSGRFSFFLSQFNHLILLVVYIKYLRFIGFLSLEKLIQACVLLLTG